jgi:exopolysaccharide production protein ExoY
MSLYDTGKRLMDIIGAVFGIILFSPLLVGGALWVKIVSPSGPILADTPERIGKNRKHFKFLKFRSMIPDAHNYLLKNPKLYKKYKENNYKIDPKEDPRLLPGARFMRKFSIDEMPQFFNVLLGDMSIVGPRAYYLFEIKDQVEKNPEAKKYIDDVMSVKPGITGVWQVSGRSKIVFADRVRLDAEYAKRRSLLYDLLIVLKTPFAVLRGEGAY